MFQKACRDWLGEPGLTLRLFAALGGMPVAEAGLALWRLAALAHADGDTEAAVSSENNWPEVRARLCRTEHGRKFLAAWDAFMTEHGHHCRGEFELSNARWCETPDYILGLVRGYLRSLGQSDPLENQRRLAEERERLTVQCRARLKNPIKRWIFSHSLRRAQELTVYREQLKNLGIRRFAFVRRVLLVLGQRLHEQGSLSCRDDIFFLEVSELEPVATGGASFDWRERIESRRREYEKNLKLNPPRVVNGRFDPNAPAWPVANADAKLLAGIPVSPGIVTGPARVILRADDHEQVLARRNSHRPVHRSGVVAVFHHRRRRGHGTRRDSLARQHRRARIRSAGGDQRGFGHAGHSHGRPGAGGWKPRPRERPQTTKV